MNDVLFELYRVDVEECEVERSQAQFDALFRKYYQEIYRYLSGPFPAMVDDLVQETFLALYHHIDEVKPETARAWLYRVAMNKGTDAVRSSSRRRQRHKQQASQESTASRGDVPETQALVRLALEKLKPRDAQILQLHSCGLSYEELAQVLDVKPGSISQLLYRAKQAFAFHYQHTQVKA